MTLEAYDLCPGGTGKRIKHCQCRDILGDLNQILRAIDGGQRVAALDQVNRLLATRANRPCLLALKCGILLANNQLQELEETTLTFLRIAPDNILALSYATTLNVVKGNISDAIDTLQKALSHVRESMPYELYVAIGMVGQALFNAGEYVAGRGHLVLQASIRKESEAVRQLVAVSRERQIPPSYKTDFRYASCPDDFRWKAEFDAARDLALRGAWKEARDQFEKLQERAPEEPSIQCNLAICQSLLAEPDASEAWHRYAALEGIDHDDAVEAEALAQLLPGEGSGQSVPIVILTFEIADANNAMEKLLSARTARRIEYVPSEDEQDSPPPKGVFVLLDQPAPNAEADLTAAQLPVVIGRLQLYGKQTDREARLEILLPKSHRLEETLSAVRELLGDSLGAQQDEKEVGSILAWRAEFFGGVFAPAPETTEMAKRFLELKQERIGQLLVERWPHVPLPVLDGKTPAQVAEEPAYRVRLLGALLVLDQWCEILEWPDVTDQICDRLKLPRFAPIDPKEVALDALPPVRRRRVQATALSDDDLVAFFEQGQMYGLTRVMIAAAHEILRRPSVRAKVDVAAIYGLLAELATSLTMRLHYLGEARRAAVEAGRSPANWLLAELPLHAMFGDTDELQRIITLLQQRHLKEPGIAEGLQQFLLSIGIDVTRQSGPPEAGAVPAESAGSSTSKLWTPDSTVTETPAETAAATSEPKSKLWVPGQD